jgi:hypothetical protein
MQRGKGAVPKKYAAYSVMAQTAATVVKYRAYVTLKPPPPIAVKMVSAFVALRPTTRIKQYNAYSAMELPRTLVVRNGASVVLRPRAVAAIVTQLVGYTIVGSPPVKVAQNTGYTILVPLNGRGVYPNKYTAYAAISPPQQATKYQFPNVT